jgi:spectinomycin phosphotransferase
MLEKPGLKDEILITCVREAYGLRVEKISFLPLGADQNTAVYRVVTSDERKYFLKLRKGDFNEASVAIPNYLSASGVRQVIPALKTRAGQLWAYLKPYRVILYPFVEGHHGFEGKLSRQQWAAFGSGLKRFHTTAFPPGLTGSIRKDDFSPRWRKRLRKSLAYIEKETVKEPVAVELAGFLKSRKEVIQDLNRRAERYSGMLQDRSAEFIVCHGDIHGWNLLIDTNGALYMVDWDTLVCAPKERDLMFIGGGLGESGYTPQEEQTMFYQGYGRTKIDRTALTYYRCERIIEDLAVYCDQIFLSEGGGKDRLAALENVRSNFAPNGTIAMAYQSDNVSKDH